MAFTRVRTKKNGKQYLYREERWREGGKVRSRSTSLGPVGAAGVGSSMGGGLDEAGRPVGWLRRQIGRTYGLDWDAIAREELERMDAEDKARSSHLAGLYLDYGLKLGPRVPVEVEKPPTVASVAAQPEVAAEESASPDGEAEVSETQSP